jgi:hypothetical protein
MRRQLYNVLSRRKTVAGMPKNLANARNRYFSVDRSMRKTFFTQVGFASLYNFSRQPQTVKDDRSLCRLLQHRNGEKYDYPANFS